MNATKADANSHGYYCHQTAAPCALLRFHARRPWPRSQRSLSFGETARVFFSIEDLGVLETGDFLPRAAFSAVPFHK
jgi:hypothetical protein